MAIDLKNLSPIELQALIANANAQMHEAHVAQVQTVKQKIETLLSDHGLTLNDVYPVRGKKGSKGVVAPKYRNPDNSSETWSGRGRQPVWFVKALKRQGASVDTLLIAPIAKGKPPAKATPAKKAGKGAPKKVAKRVGKKVAATAKG